MQQYFHDPEVKVSKHFMITNEGRKLEHESKKEDLQLEYFSNENNSIHDYVELLRESAEEGWKKRPQNTDSLNRTPLIAR